MSDLFGWQKPEAAPRAKPRRRRKKRPKARDVYMITLTHGIAEAKVVLGYAEAETWRKCLVVVAKAVQAIGVKIVADIDYRTWKKPRYISMTIREADPILRGEK